MTDLMTVLEDIGDAGEQVSAIGAAEGAAGNISVFTRELSGLNGSPFLCQQEISLPVDAAALAGGYVIISGTGKRIRDLKRKPHQTICVIQIQDNGQTGYLYTAGNVVPTSEFNSHLAIHADQVARNSFPYHAVLHGQSLYLTFLSHLPEYQDTIAVNKRLLRWEPETILVFPEGVGMLDFAPPGSPEQMIQTVAGLQSYKLVIWAKHGSVSRSEISAVKAADYLEYIETAAHYEFLNRQIGAPIAGLTDAEIRWIAKNFSLTQNLF